MHEDEDKEDDMWWTQLRMGLGMVVGNVSFYQHERMESWWIFDLGSDLVFCSLRRRVGTVGKLEAREEYNHLHLSLTNCAAQL